MDEQLKQSALDFHQFPVPGKIQVSPTKPLATQRDLALAYSPGVAAPCLEIAEDPLAAYKYTAQTPAKVVEQLRVEAARGRIEESAEPLEAIARSVGFSDPERMRRAFIRVFGLSPQAIRRLGRAG